MKPKPKTKDALSEALHLAATYVVQPRFNGVLNDKDRGALVRVIEVLALTNEEDADIDIALLRTSRAHGTMKYLGGKIGGVVGDQKALLLTISSDLDETVRDSLRLKYPKVTEAMVESAVNKHDDYKGAASRLRRAEELADIIRGLTSSVEMRSRGLEQISNNERQDAKAS